MAMLNPATIEWYRVSIEAADLSIERHPAWDVGAQTQGPTGNHYQRIPDDGGLIFVRYGPGESIEAFLAGAAGPGTTMTVLSREPARCAGRGATRITARLVEPAMRLHQYDAGGELVERVIAERQTMFVFYALTEPTPVIAGYRVREELLPALGPALDHMLNSLAPAEA